MAHTKHREEWLGRKRFERIWTNIKASGEYNSDKTARRIHTLKTKLDLAELEKPKYGVF